MKIINWILIASLLSSCAHYGKFDAKKEIKVTTDFWLGPQFTQESVKIDPSELRVNSQVSQEVKSLLDSKSYIDIASFITAFTAGWLYVEANTSEYNYATATYVVDQEKKRSALGLFLTSLALGIWSSTYMLKAANQHNLDLKNEKGSQSNFYLLPVYDYVTKTPAIGFEYKF